MKKKIKITESQYNKLQQRLMETPFDQLAKSNIKVGDIIQVTKSGKKLNFKVLASYGGEIVMDGLSSEVENFRYTLTASSLEGNKLDGHYIDKTKNQIIPTDKKTWPVFNLGIQDFQVFRNNKIVDAADINGQSSFTPPQAPEPTPVVKPTPEETPSAEEDSIPFNAPPTEEDKQEATELLTKLSDINDPLFKNLQWKQASWLEHIRAELAGRNAKHGGIQSILGRVSDYVKESIEASIGKGFSDNEEEEALYMLLENVNIRYQDNRRNVYIKAKKVLSATVLNIDFNHRGQMLYHELEPLNPDETKENGYYIEVKSKTIEDDIFLCVIRTTENPSVLQQEVNIHFFESKGYVPVAKQQKEENDTTNQNI